jgi:hypothetical protein
MSFSIISVMTGIPSLFAYGLVRHGSAFCLRLAKSLLRTREVPPLWCGLGWLSVSQFARDAMNHDATGHHIAFFTMTVGLAMAG